MKKKKYLIIEQNKKEKWPGPSIQSIQSIRNKKGSYKITTTKKCNI